MKLWYPAAPIGNFGDDLNLWLWPRLVPDLLDEDGRVLLVGIGTILNAGLPADPLKIVLGAGCGYARPPDPAGRWRFYAVRGPLTAAALRLPASVVATDPGSLVGELLGQPERVRDADQVTFMPHIVSPIRARQCGWDLEQVTRASGLGYIRGDEDVDDVINAIRGSRLLITEAMHGAIVADALRVPWVPVRIFGQVLPFKWRDWCASLGLEYEPLGIDAMAETDPAGAFASLLARAGRTGTRLSGADRLTEGTSRIRMAVDRLRDDVRSGALATLADELHADADATDRLANRGRFPTTIAARWVRVHLALERVLARVPVGGTIAIFDGGSWGLGGEVRGRTLARVDTAEPLGDGTELDLETALTRIAQHASDGASVLVFTGPMHRGPRRMAGLLPALRARYQLVDSDDEVDVFGLRPSKKPSLLDRARGRSVRS